MELKEKFPLKHIVVIVDLQFGSCGKGLLAGYLAEKNQPDTIVTAWAPNAGHTYIDDAGRKMVNIALPNGIVSKNLKRVLLGPGSVINPQQLMMEMEQYADLLAGVDVVIHENAAIVDEGHRAEEAAGMVGIGSTMKGVGAATIQKIRRMTNGGDNTARTKLMGTPLEGMVVSNFHYHAMVDAAEVLQIEGAQGYSLGINSGFYPYTTSRECTVAQVLSDCLIPLNMIKHPRAEIWGAARTFPIRVANRYKDGHMIGWSGPCYPDQHELNWKEDLGMEPELTTVTKLPRRIFSFSLSQMQDAIRANGINRLFMNFMNYLNEEQAIEFMSKLAANGMYPHLAGVGPTKADVKEIVNDDPAQWDIPF